MYLAGESHNFRTEQLFFFSAQAAQAKHPTVASALLLRHRGSARRPRADPSPSWPEDGGLCVALVLSSAQKAAGTSQ